MPKKKSAKKMKKLSGKQLAAMFVVFFVLHAATVYFGNQWYPNHIVLGTHFFSPNAALIYSMVAFTILTVKATPVIEHVSDALKIKLKDGHWMGLYLVINAAGLWIVTRFAEMLGFGVSSWQVIVALAVAMTALQGIAVSAIVMKMK